MSMKNCFFLSLSRTRAHARTLSLSLNPPFFLSLSFSLSLLPSLSSSSSPSLFLSFSRSLDGVVAVSVSVSVCLREHTTAYWCVFVCLVWWELMHSASKWETAYATSSHCISMRDKPQHPNQRPHPSINTGNTNRERLCYQATVRQRDRKTERQREMHMIGFFCGHRAREKERETHTHARRQRERQAERERST